MVCVEKNPQITAVRNRSIPMVIGDASHPQIMAKARATHSKAILAVTSDGAVNLNAALESVPAAADRSTPISTLDGTEGPPIIVRLFDDEFAQSAQQGLPITYSGSVSFLAAPMFAAAMLGSYQQTTIPSAARS